MLGAAQRLIIYNTQIRGIHPSAAYLNHLIIDPYEDHRGLGGVGLAKVTVQHFLTVEFGSFPLWFSQSCFGVALWQSFLEATTEDLLQILWRLSES